MPIGRMQLPRELRSDGGIMSIGDQGGMKNYLGNQPMITAPKFWRSGPDSPPTELAYITDAEKDMIMRADLHGSLSQGPNEGPSGIMSLDSQGDYTRDRSPQGRSRQGQAQHDQHMKNILTGQQNIGQTSKVSNRVRQGAVPEYAQGPDGKMKYIGSGSKFVGKSLFNPSGYRNIYNKRGGFFGLGGQKDIQLVGSPGRQYYSFTDPRTGDAKPGFGGRILGGLMSLISGVPFVGGMIGSAIDKYKPKSYWDKLSDSEKRRLNALNITPYNEQKITSSSMPIDSLALQNFYKDPLTQNLMTKNYKPSRSLPQELIPLEEKQFMESFRTEKAPGVPYNESDFPFAGPKQTFSSPGVSSDDVTLYDAYTGGVKPVQAQRTYRTPRTIGDQVYHSGLGSIRKGLI